VDWIQLVLDRVKFLEYVKTVVNFQLP